MSRAVIPKERLSAYQRWELRSFDAGAAPRDGAARLPTAVEVERICEQARAEGHAAGYAEGKARVQEEAGCLHALLANAQSELQRLDQEVAGDLLALALDVARQMLCQALKVRPEAVLPVVQEAIRCLPHVDPQAQLVLHPDDAALVRSQRGEQLAQSGWKIVEDARIERGGCRLETGSARIDATLSSRWQRVLAAIGQDGRWLE